MLGLFGQSSDFSGPDRAWVRRAPQRHDIRNGGAPCLYRVPIRITDSSRNMDFQMHEKTQSDHRQYIKLLREMTVEQKLQIVFELTERERTALREALRQQFPDATEPELHRLFLERWNKSDA